MGKKSSDNPVVISQNGNNQLKIEIQVPPALQKKKDQLLEILSQMDEPWDEDMVKQSWQILSDLLDVNALTRADIKILMACPNISICMNIWRNVDAFIQQGYATYDDFKTSSPRLVRILSKVDSVLDCNKSESIGEIVAALFGRGFLSPQDLTDLLTSPDDSVCFWAWRNLRELTERDILQRDDFIRTKNRFIELYTLHCHEWEGEEAYGGDLGNLFWEVFKRSSWDRIINRADFLPLIASMNDSVFLDIWKHADSAISLELLRADDFRQHKERFKEITLRKIAEPPRYYDISTYKINGVPEWYVIRDLIDHAILTADDKEFFFDLLWGCDPELTLDLWVNGNVLLKQGILTIEDFHRNKEAFNKLILSQEVWSPYTMDRNRNLMHFLLDIGICTEETLVDASWMDDETIKDSARNTLIRIKFEGAIDSVIKYCKSDDPEIRKIASDELSYILQENPMDVTLESYAAAAIASLLKNDNPSVRYDAAVLCRNNLIFGLVDVLIMALGDKDPSVRFQAAYAIRENTCCRAERVFDSSLRIERIALAEIMTEYEVDAYICRILMQNTKWMQEIADRVVEKQPAVWTTDAFIRALMDGDPEAAHSAAAAFVSAPIPVVIDLLADDLMNMGPSIREYAVRVLAKITSEQVTDLLVLALTTDPDAFVSSFAARGLHGTTDERAVKALIRALSDEAALVRQSAAWALGGCRPTMRVIEALISCMDDPDEIVRYYAVCTLKENASEFTEKALARAKFDPAEIVRVGAG